MVQGKYSRKDNLLRAMDFNYPEYIPSAISVFWPLWNIYREKLEQIAIEYNEFFGGFKPGSIRYEDGRKIIYIDEYRSDAFGCVWHFTIKGYEGQVVKHPLNDWKMFKEYQFPDPEEGVPTESDGIIPWNDIYENMERAKEEGKIVVAGMPHGFFFQRLYYLRGFKNFLLDIVKKPEEFYQLVEKLTEYNYELVKRFLKFRHIDLFSFGDDLGTQDRMTISPKSFREFIFPAYKKIFGLVKSNGIRIRLHTDGHIVEIDDQLIEAGVTILNIQDRVNGLENIKNILNQGIAVDLDIDRQKLIPYGTPKEIKEYIKYLVKFLAMKKGGLIFTAEVHPPTPLENIKAIAEAFKEYTSL